MLLQFIWNILPLCFGSLNFQILHVRLSTQYDTYQGIEKKTAKLQGCEKGVVARHEAGHAVVGTAIANLIPGQPRVSVSGVAPLSLSYNFVFG